MICVPQPCCDRNMSTKLAHGVTERNQTSNLLPLFIYRGSWRPYQSASKLSCLLLMECLSFPYPMMKQFTPGHALVKGMCMEVTHISSVRDLKSRCMICHSPIFIPHDISNVPDRDRSIHLHPSSEHGWPTVTLLFSLGCYNKY